MNTFQIVLRTIVTTIDLLLTITVLTAPEMTDGHKKTFVAIVLMNLAGVWI